MEPIRIELDYPMVLHNQYNHITVENCGDLEDILGALTPVGTTFTLHIVIETTGLRERCTFINPDASVQYRSPCGYVFNSDGICPQQEKHTDTENAYRASQLQPELVASN